MTPAEAVALFGGPSAIAAGVAALWSMAKSRVARRDARELAFETRLAAVERESADCLARERDGLERLAREMARAAELAMAPRDPTKPPPASLPAPEVEEPTGVRNMRAEIEKAVLDAHMKRYLSDSERPRPPRGKMPSRPY